MATGSGLTALIQASAKGDESAWNELVRRYAPLVMAITRNHQLAPADAQDVSQTVWLRLVEHLEGLREPQALPGWLVTTTERECCRFHRQAQKVLPVDPQGDSAVTHGSGAAPDSDLLRAELRQALRDGLAELPARDQRLLRLRAADPPASYEEISRLLGMPIGSIGPSVRRSLEKLRQTRAMRTYLAATSATDRAGRPA